METKFERITKKVNAITEELTKNIDIGDELLVSTEDMESSIMETFPILSKDSTEVEVLNNGEFLPATEIAASVVNIQKMVSDFNYIRDSLRETTENSKKVLSVITEELIVAEGSQRAALITAFAELNKAQTDSIRMFLNTYKEISSMLVNFNKLHSTASNINNYTTNVLNIDSDTPQAVSVSEVIKRLNKD